MVRLRENKKIYAMKVIKKSMIDDEDDIEWVETEKDVFEQATNHPFLVCNNTEYYELHYTCYFLLARCFLVFCVTFMIYR